MILKKRTVVIVISCLCIIIIGTYIIGLISVGVIEEFISDSEAAGKQRQKQTDEVENFFAEKGYEIDIIGAHTNGREYGGPFLYGWYWLSFEIGADVILLYPYAAMEEINKYLLEMDEETRNKCFISEHFVFYYRGEDVDIISAIKEYCETFSNDETEGIQIIEEGPLSWKVI